MKTNVVASGLLLGAGLVWASNGYAGGDDLGQNGSRTQTTLQDLRDRCDAINRNPQMVKPVVDVVCDRTRLEWRECATSYNLTNQVKIRASVGMKDWMAYQPLDQDQSQKHACSTFVKHELYVKPVSEPMKCEDLLQKFKTDQDLTAHCAALIQDRVAQDPAIEQDKVTSDTFSTCGQNQFIQLDPKDPCLLSASQGQQGGKEFARPRNVRSGGQSAQQGQDQGNQSGQQGQGGNQSSQQGQDQGNQSGQQGQGGNQSGQQGQDQGNQSAQQGQGGNQSSQQGQGGQQG